MSRTVIATVSHREKILDSSRWQPTVSEVDGELVSTTLEVKKPLDALYPSIHWKNASGDCGSGAGDLTNFARSKNVLDLLNKRISASMKVSNPGFDENNRDRRHRGILPR